MEEKSHIEKFIRSLKPKIEIRLLTNQPRTLQEAFSEAQWIDKQLKDDESLRRQRSVQPCPDYEAKPRRDYDSKPRVDNTQKTNFSDQHKIRSTEEEREAKFYCIFCKKRGHTDKRCSKLHPELKRANLINEETDFSEDSPPHTMPPRDKDSQQPLSSYVIREPRNIMGT